MNLHYLCHFPEMINNFGPLPVQSAYFTESTMGVIAKRVKTGTNIPQQVMLKMITFQSIISSCISKISSCSVPFLQSLYQYLPKICPIPKKTKTHLQPFKPNEQERLALNTTDEQLISQDRIRFNNFLICTREYNKNKAKTTINHCILSNKDKFYIVEKIAKNTNESSLLCYEFLQVQQYPLKSPGSLKFPHIFTFKKLSTALQKVEVKAVKELCTYAIINECNFIFKIFNKHI